ncbi:MAG: hypothetical protein AAGF85_07520 [Bacteroidota bacterium]
MTADRHLDTTNPDHIRYQYDHLEITILGGIRLEGLDRMRVTLKIQVEHLALRHNLDLYNDTQTEKLIRKTGVPTIFRTNLNSPKRHVLVC